MEKIIKGAKTLERIANGRNRLARAIMDRNQPVTALLSERVIKKTQFGWPGRRPRLPVDKKGRPRLTDMDLFSYLVMLYQRRAILTLPPYQTKLPRIMYAEERHLGRTRFGQVVGLIAHREQLSFSVQLYDHTIAYADAATEQEGLGRVRTFMMVDYQGHWHQGFGGLSWRFTEKEREFSDRYQLPANECMSYQYYVHPHRRQSIFGAPYVLLKLLWMRLEDEMSFLRAEILRLHDLDIGQEESQAAAPREVVSVGEATGEIVPTFRVELLGLKLQGQYEAVSDDEAGYRSAKERLRYLRYELCPLVQFMCRSDEVAFYHYGLEDDYTAPWVRTSAWIHEGCPDRYQRKASIALTDKIGLSYHVNRVSQRVAA